MFEKEIRDEDNINIELSQYRPSNKNYISKEETKKILFPLIKKTLKKFPKKKIPQSFHVDLAFTDSLLMSKLN